MAVVSAGRIVCVSRDCTLTLAPPAVFCQANRHILTAEARPDAFRMVAKLPRMTIVAQRYSMIAQRGFRPTDVANRTLRMHWHETHRRKHDARGHDGQAAKL